MKENLASLSNPPTTSRWMDQDSLTREYIDSLRSEITELRRQLQTACTEKNQLLQLFLGQASSLQASLNPVINQPSASPPVNALNPKSVQMIYRVICPFQQQRLQLKQLQPKFLPQK